MSKIIQLTAENVKRIRAVSIKPAGNVVVVGGRNAQGKSSVLDSIAMALGGTREASDTPVRVGQQTAEIILKTEDLTVRRTFSAAGGTTLTVTGADGKRAKTPQTILDQLTGKLTFDPMAFVRLDPKAQGEALRKLVGLDFTALDQERVQKYDARTKLNREIEQARAQLEKMPRHEGVPETEVSASDLVAELQAANQRNSDREKLVGDAHARKSRIELHRYAVADLEQKLTAARKALAEAEAVPEVTVPEAVDTSTISQRLADLESTNAKVRANLTRKEHIRSGKAKVAEAQAITERIEAINAEKARLLNEAKFPVPGLSLADGLISYNGIPLTQASTAEQIRVAVAIASRLNPGLRVMLVRDGSLLDDQSLQLLGEFAAEQDLQVWIERVGAGAECSVVIEDGAVVGAEPVPDKSQPSISNQEAAEMF